MAASIDVEIENGTFHGPAYLRDTWGFEQSRWEQCEVREHQDCCPGWQL